MEEATPATVVAMLLIAASLAGCVGEPSANPENSPSGREDAPGNDLLLESPPPAASAKVSGGAEPEILVDQAGEFILIGDTSGVYVSTDGGLHWNEPYIPFTGGLFGDGIGLAQDDAGTVYATSTNGQTIQVARSTSPNESWQRGQFFVDVAPIADRPWVAARGDGQVAIIYYDFGRTFQEHCLLSLDHGDTFPQRSLRPWGAPPNAGNAVFTDGDLYWADEDTVYRRSGSTGPLGRAHVCSNPIDSREVFDAIGHQVFTRVATDGQAVYTAAPTSDGGKIQIVGMDGFDEPMQRFTLNPTDGTDSLHSNTFVALSANSTQAAINSTQVAITWYGSETKGDPTDPSFDGAWNVYTARIQGFWEMENGTELTCTSKNVTCNRLTEEPNHKGEICMAGSLCDTDRDLLDYFDADHGPDGSLHVAYGDDWAGTATNGGQASPKVKYARLAPLS